MASRTVTFDDHELRELEFDLSQGPRRIRSPKGVMTAARLIDREMLIDATGHVGNYFGRPGTQYVTPTPTVSHEMTGELSAEIGIENRGSGSLFHILAYGSVHNAPAYDPGAGPRRALRGVEKALADEAENAVFGRRGHTTA